MSDRVKIFLALLFFIAAIVLPLIGLGIGWVNWDVETGLVLMGVTFMAFFILGGVTLYRLEDLNWLTVSLPYLFGLGYTLSPDLIPLGGDDAAVTAVGSVMAYLLALRKDPRTPKWIIVPLLLAAGYTLIGGPIPGGVDELIVNVLAVSIAGYGINRNSKKEEDNPELVA